MEKSADEELTDEEKKKVADIVSSNQAFYKLQSFIRTL